MKKNKSFYLPPPLIEIETLKTLEKNAHLVEMLKRVLHNINLSLWFISPSEHLSLPVLVANKGY